MSNVSSLDLSNINPLVSVDLLSSITFALIILLAGFAVGKLVGVALLKFLNIFDFNKNVKKIKGSLSNPSRSISSFVSSLIYVASVIFALLSLGIFKITLLILVYFIGFLVLGSLIFGFFFSLPNFVLSFGFKKKLRVNDFIIVGNVSGEIFKLGFFNILIKGEGKDFFVVPYSLVKKGFKIVKKERS
jgi:hypothetical protein